MVEPEFQLGQTDQQDLEHKKIVEQIFNLQGNLTRNISKILEQVSQKDQAGVLMALHLYFRANGKTTTDLCFMGIADQFLDKEFKPGDFVLFTYVQKIRRDDILMVLSKESDGKTNTLFRKVTDILPDKRVQMESDSGIGRIVSRDDILGKIARVIPFAGKEWNEIATEIAYKVQLQQMLVDVRKTDGLDDGQKREIDKRLAYLNR